jgi:WhiB family transcriptional regulator, redox-sensing transcriptional regulator
MTGVPHIAAPALRPLLHDWEWQDHAACATFPEDLFFPPDLATEPHQQSREAMHSRRVRETRAKLVCARCPVIEPCREHALELPEEEGVWGGLTAEERGELRRVRRGGIPAPRRMASATG